MSVKTAKIIFFLGTAISAILFLALTFDTHRQFDALTNAEQLTDEVVAGKRAFQKYNCNDCHTILGFGGYYAPDLTKVYQRMGEKYISNILKSPETVLSKSFRKMPQQNLTPEEITNLVSFFKWVNEIDTHDWPPQDSKKRRSSGTRSLMSGGSLSIGAALFKENSCFDCHKLQDVGSEVGPALDDVGARLTEQKIKTALINPASLNPNTEMPEYSDISEEDIQALVDFLAKQKGGVQ